MDVDRPAATAPSPITRENWFLPGNLRWALRNGPALVPSAVIARGDGPVTPLPPGPTIDLDEVRFRPGPDRPEASAAAYLESIHADGFLVLHRGRLVAERYFAGMGAGQPHQWASLSKSVTGLLAAVLGHEGLLDDAPPVRRYVPELAGTPFGEATVRQCLDMEASADWPEGMTELDWLAAAGLAPPPAAGGPVGVRTFVRTVPRACGRPHGSCFHYNNPAAEAVAWAIERAAGRPWHELVADRIWSRIGAEADASVLLDPTGVPLASGGMNATLRDLARLAEVVRAGGVANGRQVLPAAAVAACVTPATNADRFAAGNIASGRAGYSFRNLWYHANDEDRSIVATGRFGQRAVINPKRQAVIAMLGAHPGRSDETAEGVEALIRSVLDALPGHTA